MTNDDLNLANQIKTEIRDKERSLQGLGIQVGTKEYGNSNYHQGDNQIELLQKAFAADIDLYPFCIAIQTMGMIS